MSSCQGTFFCPNKLSAKARWCIDTPEILGRYSLDKAYMVPIRNISYQTKAFSPLVIAYIQILYYLMRFIPIW